MKSRQRRHVLLTVSKTRPLYSAALTFLGAALIAVPFAVAVVGNLAGIP